MLPSAIQTRPKCGRAIRSVFACAASCAGAAGRSIASSASAESVSAVWPAKGSFRASKRQVGKGNATMMTDPISDMLTRLRNANRIERPAVDMPATKLKQNIAQVLKDEGFIVDYQLGEIAHDPQGHALFR